MLESPLLILNISYCVYKHLSLDGINIGKGTIIGKMQFDKEKHDLL